MARLVVWVKVDRTEVETNINGQLDYNYEHPKLATRLDHIHKLNKTNLEQK